MENYRNLIALALIIIAIVIPSTSWTTTLFEQELDTGEQLQTKAITLLTGRVISPKKSIDYEPIWQEIRSALLQSMQTKDEKFKQFTKLLDASERHLKESAFENNTFPTPYFYMGINGCIGADLKKAGTALDKLVELEFNAGITQREQKAPVLEKLITLHFDMADQQTRQANYQNVKVNFNEFLSQGVAAFTTYWLRGWLLESSCSFGYYLSGPNHNILYVTCPEFSQQIPGKAVFEPLIFFQCVNWTCYSLLSYISPYSYFWPLQQSRPENG